MPIQTDYHMHTPLCGHAKGPMEACVERAIELGLREIGFACHNPLPEHMADDVRMSESELDYYVQRVTDLQFQYRGKINVLLGMEMDYIEGQENYLKTQATAYPWDYLIGSVHYLDPHGTLCAWSRNLPFDAEEQYTRYYSLVQKLARSGLYDIVGHLDVPKRSGRLPGPRGLAELERAWEEIAKAGLCLELNTSGFRHIELTTPEPYPSLPIVERALALGIPFVVNSDAHAPEQVGTMFREMEAALRQRGCRQLARFHQRQRQLFDF
jgi:histidinol-phosphatase (PHP family)